VWIFSLQNRKTKEGGVRSTRMGRPNRSQITKQIGLKQALLRARSRARFTVPKEQDQSSRTEKWQASFYNLSEVEFRVLQNAGIGWGLVKEGLRVIWTYRIGWNLLPTGKGCLDNHRGRRKGEGDCPPAGVAVATREGRRRGRVE
jgi:hypothetical protein